METTKVDSPSANPVIYQGFKLVGVGLSTPLEFPLLKVE
jgi:hypothetical protein